MGKNLRRRNRNRYAACQPTGLNLHVKVDRFWQRRSATGIPADASRKSCPTASPPPRVKYNGTQRCIAKSATQVSNIKPWSHVPWYGYNTHLPAVLWLVLVPRCRRYRSDRRCRGRDRSWAQHALVLPTDKIIIVPVLLQTISCARSRGHIFRVKIKRFHSVHRGTLNWQDLSGK